MRQASFWTHLDVLYHLPKKSSQTLSISVHSWIRDLALAGLNLEVNKKTMVLWCKTGEVSSAKTHP
jgi:hypothetical protein